MGKKYMYGYGKELKLDYVPFFCFFFLSCLFILCFLSLKKSAKSSYIYISKKNKKVFKKLKKSIEGLKDRNRQDAFQTQYK